MISRLLGTFVVVILLSTLVLGCSNSTGGVPTLPNAGSEDLTALSTLEGAKSLPGSHVLWGMWEITIDPSTLEADVIPLRGASFNANVTQFMQPPMAPMNLINVYVDPGAGDIANGLFAVDITLNHPFPGMGQFSGFDVRGVFMVDGSVSSAHYGGLMYAGEDEARLMNADGWTRWWNPTEFTSFETIFGYTQGLLATPGFKATATLNAHKYFCDGLGAEDDPVIDPDSRGFFSTVPGVNTRRYMIQFTMDGGSPVVSFNYAVDASWSPPDTGAGPDFTPDDYSLSANCQEAYMLGVEDAGSTAWYVDPSSNGGDLLFDITVYDWQSVENPDGVSGEVAAIWVESAELMDAPVNVLPTATALPDGPTSSVFRVDITDVHPTDILGQTLLIGVESANPTNYAPNLEGITGFDFPDEPLAAYIFWDAPIDDEEPIPPIPAPTGLDSCAAAGVVKLFWDPVDWPTLAGYNIYKKESTAGSYDFDNPLNTEIVTETTYIDTDVQMDGMTYDYVVKAVDSDTTESQPSNETTATPVYNTPTGFTDLDNPDGEMGNYNTSDFVNAHISADGTVYLVYGFATRFVRSSITDPTNFTELYLGSYAYGRYADVEADSNGNAHVVWGNWSNPTRRYYYAMVTPGNDVQNFQELHSFSGAGSSEGESTIAVTPDDEIHIIMPSHDGSYNLTYMHGQSGSFSSPEVITYQVNTSIYHMRPDMASDRFGNIHVAWTGLSGVIYYLKCDSEGNWGSVENVSSGVSGYDNWAAVAADYLGAVHIAWHISGVYRPGYANNRSGSWQGQLISGARSGNCVGVACDPDGNAYVDCWSGSGGDRRNRVILIDRNNNVVEIAMVNDDTPYDASWCSFAGIIDPCWDSNTSTMAFWRDFPPSPKPKYARIQTDY